MLSGLIFLLLGALLSEPLVLYIGQIQVSLLALSYMLMVPEALALDRRRVTMSIEHDDQLPGPTGALVVGAPQLKTVRIENHSGVSLYAFECACYGTGGAFSQATTQGGVQILGPRSATTLEVEVRFGQSGRWVLQGFDVMIKDPLGLLQSRDYLPCVYPFEVYPQAIHTPQAQLKRAGNLARQDGGLHAIDILGLSTDVRELREHQPGDPLRHIAWKASVRRGRLVSKNFEHETSLSVYLMLDISCSMRGGQHPGQKLEQAMELVVGLMDRYLSRRDAVGLVTFDEKLYGHITPSASASQRHRLLHHLVGLRSVVDGDLTEFDEEEVEAMVVDYLLVQERLDFRKGAPKDTPINHDLLERWLRGKLPELEATLESPVLRQGCLPQNVSRVRAFAQWRGVEIPYRAEARLGMKERGLVTSLDHLMAASKGRHQLVVVSDLCGIMNIDLLTRGIKLCLARGHALHFIVPFTPAFYEPIMGVPRKYEILKELFTHSEKQERMQIVTRLRQLGVQVSFHTPAARRRAAPPADHAP